MYLKSKLKVAVFTFAVVAALFFLMMNVENSFAYTGQKPVLIAHGGGTVEGYSTTNSVEAVQQAIEEGYELIELDMDFSRDGKIIMLHDWDRTSTHYFGNPFERRLDEKEFERLLIHDKFHTLTFEKLIPILDQAPHIKIVTDVKGNNLELLGMIAKEYPKYINQMIPQIYGYSQYDAVKDMGYEDIILTLYAMPYIDYEELLRFARQTDLYAVTTGDGYDSVIKDLKYKLAGDGITVYYHPVSDYEHALEQIEGGVYGVYASTLIPAEFEEPLRSYYLLDKGARLQDMVTKGKSRQDITNIYVKNGAGKTIQYVVDGQEMTDELLEELDPGRHQLSISITVFGKTAELSYILWAEEDYFRILDKKYEYRIQEAKILPEMKDIFNNDKIIDSDIRTILEQSLIAKSGEYYGYNNGRIVEFKVNDEDLYVRNHYNGSVLVPLAECAKMMGASSVVMDKQRYVYVYYDEARTLLQANTSYISQGYKSNTLKTPLVLYRSKVMASGEVFGIITGRAYIDDKDFLIVLPEGADLQEVSQETLLYAASLLYE